MKKSVNDVFLRKWFTLDVKGGCFYFLQKSKCLEIGTLSMTIKSQRNRYIIGHNIVNQVVYNPLLLSP